MGAQQSSGARAAAPTNGACPASQDTRSSSSCPVPENVRSNAIYNVYNQRIDKPEADLEPGLAPFMDPRNNMPLSANQQPYPGQRILLPIDRVQSTIPKGGTESTWEYPSPQMFYNGASGGGACTVGGHSFFAGNLYLPLANNIEENTALKRKGKDGGISDCQDRDETDLSGVMESVVLTHNSLNEMTWRAIQKWENLHPEKRDEVKLNRFIGRPHDISPLAWIHQMMGGPAPFDRHDWYVLRDGKEVRYVIDFYFDESQAGSAEVCSLCISELNSQGPSLSAAICVQAFTVTERPALDTLENGLDRARMAIYSQCARWGVPCPVTGQGHSN